MANQDNAARLLKDIHAAQDRKLRLQALKEPYTFITMAEQQGYHFSMQTLPEEVTRLSEEAIAAIWNPGIGPRRHLMRR